MRTIVLSDVHGEPGIIRAVVEHSGLTPGTDRLIFAGDAIEIGRDSLGCLDLLQEFGAECLVGNHEWVYFTGSSLEPEPVDSRVLERVDANLTSGSWRLAAEADGVLITHAGASVDLQDKYEEAGSVSEFVARLNAGFEGAIANVALEDADPLWWRPGRADLPLEGVVQVMGHTPIEFYNRPDAAALMEQLGLYLIDPWVRGWRKRAFAPPVPVRYAVIEDGADRKSLTSRAVEIRPEETLRLSVRPRGGFALTISPRE